MREVSKGEFYRVIGAGDIVCRVADGPYPYTTIFETRYGLRQVGRVTPDTSVWPYGEKYFLKDSL